MSGILFVTDDRESVNYQRVLSGIKTVAEIEETNWDKALSCKTAHKAVVVLGTGLEDGLKDLIEKLRERDTGAKIFFVWTAEQPSLSICISHYCGRTIDIQLPQMLRSLVNFEPYFRKPPHTAP